MPSPPAQFEAELHLPPPPAQFEAELHCPLPPGRPLPAQFEAELHWPPPPAQFEAELHWPPPPAQFEAELHWPAASAVPVDVRRLPILTSSPGANTDAPRVPITAPAETKAIFKNFLRLSVESDIFPPWQCPDPCISFRRIFTRIKHIPFENQTVEKNYHMPGAGCPSIRTKALSRHT